MRFTNVVAVALLTCAAGFRVRPKRSKQQSTGQAKGEPGQVDGLFSMASPGVASPPLENPRGGPCFPGFRSWTMKNQWFGVEADLAVTITGVLGYRHAFQEGHEIDLKKNELRTYPCNPPDTETPNIPRGWPKNLHDRNFYIQGSQNHSDLAWAIGNVGIDSSYTLDRAAAAAQIAAKGWELIGSAVDEGGGLYVGRQVSHLIQHPQTKECILTFQGSSSAQDWIANFNVAPSHFCGFVGATEFCAENDDPSADCAVAKAGESFVHEGFRDALRAIVRNEDWQSDVRPKLPTCSKVYVTGHSLGGVQATLFAACAQKAPQPGEYGYDEDYKYIGWTV